MKAKTLTLALIAAIAGVFVYTRPHNAIPSDLRDAVADKAMDTLTSGSGALDKRVPEPEIKPFYVETGSRKGLRDKGYMAGNDPSVGVPDKPVEWVVIRGGRFMMGTDDIADDFDDSTPIHEVTIKTFEMSKTAVTVEQYAECVTKGACTEPLTGEYCDNWGVPGRELHPVTCVDWDQAQAYAKFKGARLPSESEWEYAATSGGRNQKYPWGNAEPTCDKAVMYGNGGYGCGKNSTWPVCSKPAGNTAQGLCDMVGNVWQWVQDKYQDSYQGAPVDGGAFEGAGSKRGLRGGSFADGDASQLRADYRARFDPDLRNSALGFRLARSR